jgi:tetratricopeptide (TPR) repeat protein
VLFDQEKYPEALEQYTQARTIYKSVNNRIKLAYGETNRANILWRIGRTAEARQILSELGGAASQTDEGFGPVLAAVSLISAEISLSERNLSEAAAKSQEALTRAGNKYLDTAIEATITAAIVKELVWAW